MPPNASGSPDLPNLTLGVLVRSRWPQLREPVDHLEEPLTLFVAQLVFVRSIAGYRLADDHALRLPQPCGRLAQLLDGLLVEGERELCHTAILPYRNTAAADLKVGPYDWSMCRRAVPAARRVQLHLQQIDECPAAGEHALTFQQGLAFHDIELEILCERVDEILVGHRRRKLRLCAHAL